MEEGGEDNKGETKAGEDGHPQDRKKGKWRDTPQCSRCREFNMPCRLAGMATTGLMCTGCKEADLRGSLTKRCDFGTSLIGNSGERSDVYEDSDDEESDDGSSEN